MKIDKGVERVRKAREKLAKKCDYDLHKLDASVISSD